MKFSNCIYRFLNKDGQIIYIGKAHDLKNRLNSHNHLPKECYSERNKIEFTMFETEDEMDLAERYYIPKIKPKYNDQMKDRDIIFNIYELDNVKWQEYSKKINKKITRINKRKNESKWTKIRYDACKTIYQYDIKGKLINKYNSIKELRQNMPNIKQSGLNQCLNEKTKSYYGYIWSYKFLKLS